MIQQKLTKTKTTMILITKTLVISPLFTLQHDDFDHQSQAGRARATKPRPCNFLSTGDQTNPKPH